MKNIFSGVAASMFLVAITSFAQPAEQPAAQPAAQPTMQPAIPSDAQIAAIAVAANSVDINAGKVAKSKSKNNEIKAFAQKMIADHTGVNRSAVVLVNKLKITPEESPESNRLKEEGAASLRQLKGLKNAEFDKAYIDNEITFHQKVLDTLDKTLIPNARNAEMKSFLIKVRLTIDDHLQHAKRIQAAMG